MTKLSSTGRARGLHIPESLPAAGVCYSAWFGLMEGETDDRLLFPLLRPEGK